MTIRAIFSNHSAIGKLLITIGVCLVLTTLFTTIAFMGCSAYLGLSASELQALASDYSDPTGIAIAKVLQSMMSLGFFIIPPFVLAFLFNGEIKSYLLLENPADKQAFLAVIGLVILLLPLVNALGEFNNQLKLPESMAGIEKLMREKEDQLALLTKAFLRMPGVSDLLLNIVVVALLPAIGEELVFRGVLQRLFNELVRNRHAAVILTAFVFSAIHMQFYGFLPRFVLGLLLGYLTVWSGSLWLSVTAHFVNNAGAVLMSFLFEHGYSSVNPDEYGTSSSDFLMVMLSIVLGAALLFWIRRKVLNESDRNFYLHKA
ncbi:MAG: lysostaphin resistance A-like protein [Bacteroidota bacterium]